MGVVCVCACVCVHITAHQHQRDESVCIDDAIFAPAAGDMCNDKCICVRGCACVCMCICVFGIDIMKLLVFGARIIPQQGLEWKQVDQMRVPLCVPACACLCICLSACACLPLLVRGALVFVSVVLIICPLLSVIALCRHASVIFISPCFHYSLPP